MHASVQAAPAEAGPRPRPRFARIGTDIPAVLVDPARGAARQGRVENLAVGGMYFHGADGPEVGTRVLCALIRWDGDYEDQFDIGGTVAHRRDQGIGIAFDRVTPFGFVVISEMVEAAGRFQVVLTVDG
jgi:hypothetical protein